MTKEEILAMEPGKELNRIVAEVVMGYKYVDDQFFGDMEGYGNSIYHPLRKYSEDSAIAEEVVDRMKHEKYNARVELNHYTENWEADFGYGRISSPTAAEAICKVAVITIMEAECGC